MGKYKGFAGSGMNANKNMSNVIKQAQKMQAEMEKVQEELVLKHLRTLLWSQSTMQSKRLTI